MGEPPGKYCCIYLVCLFKVEGKAVGFTFLDSDEKGTEIQSSSTVQHSTAGLLYENEPADQY